METLHADLIPYVVNGIVHHPLVVTPLATDASSINQTYRNKLDQVKKAEDVGDWTRYIFLYERFYRLDALLSATQKGLEKKPSEFWALVSDVWQDSENIRQNLSRWKRVWRKKVENRQACMSKEDLCVFDRLPEQIEIWRGTSHKRYVDGISWTLEREKAIRFARRFSSKPRVPLVARGIVKKGDVLAYFGGRNEREIVSMQVERISVTKIDHLSSDSR